ncbi:hypothetical protein IG631_16819 [Alternaria alternata]|nr:hypothetical protein IG631_16819 [Alternaria alternata]
MLAEEVAERKTSREANQQARHSEKAMQSLSKSNEKAAQLQVPERKLDCGARTPRHSQSESLFHAARV